MNRLLPRIFLFSALLTLSALAILSPRPGVYPALEILVPGGDAPISLKATFEQQTSVSACESLTGNIVRVTLEKCPTCQILASRCDSQLTKENAKIIGKEPLPFPVGRLRNGAMAFVSPDASAAQQACIAAAEHTVSSSNPISCLPAGSVRHRAHIASPLHVAHTALFGAAAICAWVVGWFIRRYEHLHGHITHDTVGSGPQKMHSRPTPRIGGLQVLTGLIFASIIASSIDLLSQHPPHLLHLACILPAFMGGLFEDVTRRVGVVERLFLTMLSGALACWLIGTVITRTDIPPLDWALNWLPLAVVFSSFAIAGIANSINIIDGVHGLASGTAIIMACSLAYVSWAVGDDSILLMTLMLAGSLIGFFVWNWPKGIIFLGDGGAYAIGTTLATTSILLVLHNPTISPWFPVAIMCHPVLETLVSIGRRYATPNKNIAQADNDHLHQRIFHRLARNATPEMANPAVAKYVWMPTIIIATLATWNFTSTRHQLAVVAIATCLFLLAYTFLRPSDPTAYKIYSRR